MVKLMGERTREERKGERGRGEEREGLLEVCDGFHGGFEGTHSRKNKFGSGRNVVRGLDLIGEGGRGWGNRWWVVGWDLGIICIWAANQGYRELDNMGCYL